ncbi:MAG: radical SAM protein [Bryobacteraceae bacterium]|nr:radical SAM protein [Bryobacteraceae bacterium]MDW8380446.1 radical SAM protein [Bryobacterales bacterium]
MKSFDGRGEEPLTPLVTTLPGRFFGASFAPAPLANTGHTANKHQHCNLNHTFVTLPLEMSAAYTDLLRVRGIEKVTLEFTTRCNLKCVYCAVTRPWHRKADLDLSAFDELVREMQALGVKQVQISGGGETTIVKDWDHYLEKLLASGFQVTIISNLAKPLTARAVRALSYCSEITASCDTVVADMYAEIRKGGDLETFVYNILRIRAQCAIEQRSAPRLIWNAVASDKMIFDVDQWVAMGLALGVDHFQISEMAKYDDLPGMIRVNPLATLSDEDLARARATVEKARRLAQGAGKWFTLLPAVEEVLRGSRKLMRTEVELETGSEGRPVLKSSRTFVQIVGPDGTWHEAPEPPPTPVTPGKTTKNCLMPWSEAFIWATNDLAPCCMYKRIREFRGVGLLEALNSEPLVRIREGLLTGNLLHGCAICPMFGSVEVEVFQERVRALFSQTASAAT